MNVSAVLALDGNPGEQKFFSRQWDPESLRDMVHGRIRPAPATEDAGQQQTSSCGQSTTPAADSRRPEAGRPSLQINYPHPVEVDDYYYSFLSRRQNEVDPGKETLLSSSETVRLFLDYIDGILCCDD